jgi:hypothetical protein
MAFNENGNLLRKSKISSKYSSYLIVLFFILVRAVHYHRPHPPLLHQYSLTDAVVHGIENIHSNDDRRASSVQSLQTTLASQIPLTSTSQPRLQHYRSRQLSSPTPPFSSNTTLSLSTNKKAPIYPSLHHIDNLRSCQTSISKSRLQDEKVHYSIKKPSNECTISKEITAILSENNENDNSLIKIQPIEIRVRCIFSRVGEIDTLNERYTAEIFFEASWFDQDNKIESKYDPQAGHFNPQLVVLNHIGDSLRHEVNKIKKNIY